jgi:hypothetical protein
MKSHHYDLRPGDLAAVLAPPIVGVLLFAALMHAGAYFGFLPAPRPQADVDQTILLHQAESSMATHDADLVVVGDSSCLMDCSARELETRLPGRKVLNLGTLSYLNLQLYGDLVQRYARANPGRLRTVVVLVHPVMLNRVESSPYHVDALSAIFRGADLCDRETAYGRLACVSGLEIFRGRVLGRCVSTPLRGHYALYYGFNTGIRRHMTLNHGSAIDPRPPLLRSARSQVEYRLSESLQAPTRALRSAIPAGVELLAGVTPIPETHASQNYESAYQDMLRRWTQWMSADSALTNLPPTLPPHLFAGSTHLNAEGAREFTRILARELRARPPNGRRN